MSSVLVVAAVMVASACGGSSAGATYSPNASSTSLLSAGWHVTASKGMKPLSGGRQLGYLIATSPSGNQVDIQFLESPDRAKKELAAVRKADPKFRGTTIGSALVLSHQGMGDAALTKATLDQLTRLLK